MPQMGTYKMTDNLSKIKHINETIGYMPVAYYDYFLKDMLVCLVIITLFGIVLMFILKYFKVIKCDWFFSIKKWRS